MINCRIVRIDNKCWSSEERERSLWAKRKSGKGFIKKGERDESWVFDKD